MPEIVGTFVRAQTQDEGANSSTQRWDGRGGELAQESLEFAEGHLHRVKVGGKLRQMAKGCSRGLDRLTNAGDFVGSKIIDHHDVVSLQCWHEAMFDIGKEHFSGHRPIEHHRCHHLVVTKHDDESAGLPGPLRHIINHPRATWSAAVEPHQLVLTAVSSIRPDGRGPLALGASAGVPEPRPPATVRLPTGFFYR